jgi:hypothetical protein
MPSNSRRIFLECSKLRQKLVYGLALLSIFLFFSTTIVNASATSYTVGVTPGTTASYTIAQTGQTSTTTATIKVTSVSGTTITFTGSGALPNGTALPTVETVDVSNGSSFPFFIGANLGAGDPVYTNALFTINGTETMNVGGASRSVNYLIETVAIGGQPYFIFNLYWDKPTGMLAEGQIWIYGLTGGSWLNMTMTSAGITGGSSSAPGGLSSTDLLLIGVVVVVVVVIALVFVLRRGRK